MLLERPDRMFQALVRAPFVPAHSCVKRLIARLTPQVFQLDKSGGEDGGSRYNILNMIRDGKPNLGEGWPDV